MKNVCTLYLQRNLPDVTNAFGDHFLKWNDDISDFYVIESGSDKDNLSKFKDRTFYADWPDAVQNGLRFCRGFNYGLIEMQKLAKNYEFIVLAFGDTELFDEPTIEILMEEMDRYPKMGIITPTSPRWGDDINKSFHDRDTVAHWLTPHVFWMFRTEYINQVAEQNNDFTFMNYFYDGNNFRGYDADTEMILKAYQNDWFFAVTRKASHNERHDLTVDNYKLMKTEPYNVHKSLMWDEGMKWLKQKYGFDGKQQMRHLVMSHFVAFFQRNPELMDLPGRFI